MSNIQLKGTAMLAPTGETLVDYSDFITSFEISRVRNTVTEPATLGTGREVEKAGTLSETLTINFFSDLAAASFWAMLYDLIDENDPILDFESRLEEGAVGADNPQFAGSATLTSITTGNDVGSLRSNSVTLPITGAGIAKTVA